MMLLPAFSRELKLLRDDATEHLQRSLTILRAKNLPEAMQGYLLVGAWFRRKKARFWLSRMRFLLECGDGPRTNRRASTKQRLTILGIWARGQHGSVGGLYVCPFWGDQAQLDRFLQVYAVEVVRRESRKKGFTVTEQPLQNGSILVQVIEGGS